MSIISKALEIDPLYEYTPLFAQQLERYRLDMLEQLEFYESIARKGVIQEVRYLEVSNDIKRQYHDMLGPTGRWLILQKYPSLQNETE